MTLIKIGNCASPRSKPHRHGLQAARGLIAPTEPRKSVHDDAKRRQIEPEPQNVVNNPTEVVWTEQN
jgi:hypothetical protein